MTLQVTATCQKCNATFKVDVATFAALKFEAFPKHCPTCLDRKQRRPEVVESRETLFSTVVQLDKAIAGLGWEEFQAQEGDRKVFQSVLKGKRFGADWYGRIDLYSHIGLPEPGQICVFSEKIVKKTVWVQKWTRMTMHHGPVSGYRRCAPDAEGAEERQEEDRYCVLLPADGLEPEGRLVFISAYSKTTLKGFGRQFHANLRGTPLWYKEIRGGVRSGRAYTVAWLAVVNPDHPVFHCHREGGEETETKII